MSENNNVEQELDLNQLMKVRREKLDKLKQEGKDPYKITKFNRTHTSKQIIYPKNSYRIVQNGPTYWLSKV